MNHAWILRGLPGAGKSTAAGMLMAAANTLAEAYEADDYFVRQGKYKFCRDKLQAAHKMCLCGWLDALYRGVGVVICANTNITAIEIAPYYATAEASGYSVHIFTIASTVAQSATRNVHGVPVPKLEKMSQALVQEQQKFPLWWHHTVVESPQELVNTSFPQNV